MRVPAAESGQTIVIGRGARVVAASPLSTQSRPDVSPRSSARWWWGGGDGSLRRGQAVDVSGVGPQRRAGRGRADPLSPPAAAGGRPAADQRPFARRDPRRRPAGEGDAAPGAGSRRGQGSLASACGLRPRDQSARNGCTHIERSLHGQSWSRRGAGSRPARVVAPTTVKGGSSSGMAVAPGPLPTMTSTRLSRR